MKMEAIAAILTALFLVSIVSVANAQVATITISVNPPSPLLTGTTITLSAEGFDSGGNSLGSVTADTTFSLLTPAGDTDIVEGSDPTYVVSIPGVYTITGEYDGVQSESVTVTVHSLTVEKELVGGSEDPPQYVPINTPVSFDLKITVTNPDDTEGTPGDVTLTDVSLQDGIGADLDLVIQSDPTGRNYIFEVDGTPQYLDLSDNAFYGDSGPVSWKKASDKAYNKGKRCATIITWAINTLADGGYTTLEFTVQTNTFATPKEVKQSYTSTCHHELNSGPEVTYIHPTGDAEYTDIVVGKPVVVSAYDNVTDNNGDGIPDADSDGDGWTDMDEVAAGTDPCDASHFPILE